MPFTELVFASLKPGSEIRAGFDEWIPKLLSAAATANAVFATHSVLESQNGEKAEGSERKAIFCAEWASQEDFTNIVNLPDFMATLGGVSDFVSTPVKASLFKTDKGPSVVVKGNLIEIFRIPLRNEDSATSEAQKLWDAFVEQVKFAGAGALKETASGPSVNLEERKFVGIVGWKDEATRLKSLENDYVGERRNALEKGGKVETFTAQF